MSFSFNGTLKLYELRGQICMRVVFNSHARGQTRMTVDESPNKHLNLSSTLVEYYKCPMFMRALKSG